MVRYRRLSTQLSFHFVLSFLVFIYAINFSFADNLSCVNSSGSTDLNDRSVVDSLPSEVSPFPLNISVVGTFHEYVSQYPEGGCRIENMCTYGSFAILANHMDGLKVLNVTNPTAPSKVFHDYYGGRWFGVSVVGDHLYVAHHGDGLQIFDIHDPTNPLKYGILWLNYDPPYTNPQDVAVQVSYVYLADDFRGLQVIDVSDRSWPIGVGRWNDGGDAKGVVVDDTYVFLVERSGELEVIDVSIPTEPVEVANLIDGGAANNLVLAESLVYIADLEDGLEIVNVSNPLNPSIVHRYQDGSGQANGVAINESLVFLADGSDGLLL